MRFNTKDDLSVSYQSYAKNFSRDDKTARLYLYVACELNKYLYLYSVVECREYVFRCLNAAISAVYRDSITKRGTSVSTEVDSELADLMFLGIGVMQCKCYEMLYEAVTYSIEILYKYSGYSLKKDDYYDELEQYGKRHVIDKYFKEEPSYF